MTLLPRPLATPDLPWRFEAPEPGDYVVIVDVEEATRSVVWVNNVPSGQMTLYRRAGRLHWFTIVPVEAAGTLIQLETDGADPVFQVLPQAAADLVPLPPIGLGIARAR